MTTSRTWAMLWLLLGTFIVTGAPAFGSFDHPTVWAGIGDSYSSGEGIPGARGPCQRGHHQGTDATAWPVGAYELLIDDEAVVFQGMGLVACTGAITDDAEGQLDEASDRLDRSEFEIVTLSFGGNNIGFADVLLGCLDVNNLPWGALDLPGGCDVSEAEMRDRIDMLAGKAPIGRGYRGSVTLPQLYDRIADRVPSGGDVLVVGYPHLVEEPDRWPRWQRTLLPYCQGIQKRDVPLIRSATGYLNEQLALAVEDADERHHDEGIRFHFLDVSRDPYEFSESPDDRHALCSRDPWLNGLTTGISSGTLRKERSFHPTQEGHRNTARVVADYFRRSVRMDDGAWELTPIGIGPIALGMSAEEVRALGIDLRTERGPFCDAWKVPGVTGIRMAAPRSSGVLESISIIGGRSGAGGVVPGDSEAELLNRFGARLKSAGRFPELNDRYYRLYGNAGETAVQFTVDTSKGEVAFEEAGYVGQFYYPDGNELCA